jgi:hypothetical protein
MLPTAPREMKNPCNPCNPWLFFRAAQCFLEDGVGQLIWDAPEQIDESFKSIRSPGIVLGQGCFDSFAQTGFLPETRFVFPSFYARRSIN